MAQILKPVTVLATFAVLALSVISGAQAATEVPPGITTPDRIETRIGTLSSSTTRQA